MDCRTARMLVDIARPNAAELDASERHDFEAHLGQCGDCRGYSDSERAVDERLGRAMRAVAIPPGLRDRLLTRLSNERNAFYRSWLFRGIAGAAAAAVVLIAVGLLLHSMVAPEAKPLPIDPSTIVERFKTRPALPSKPQDAVEDFVKGQGIPFEMPDDFKKRWDWDKVQLTEKYVWHENGCAVPVLEFERASGNERARAVVLFVPRGKFDPAKLPKFEDNYGKVGYYGRPGQDEYIALVVIQEGKLNDFLKPTSFSS